MAKIRAEPQEVPEEDCMGCKFRGATWRLDAMCYMFDMIMENGNYRKLP